MLFITGVWAVVCGGVLLCVTEVRAEDVAGTEYVIFVKPMNSWRKMNFSDKTVLYSSTLQISASNAVVSSKVSTILISSSSKVTFFCCSCCNAVFREIIYVEVIGLVEFVISTILP